MRMSVAGMTKDELRSALSEKGVTSPSSARKDELVALYNSVNEAGLITVKEKRGTPHTPNF